MEEREQGDGEEARVGGSGKLNGGYNASLEAFIKKRDRAKCREGPGVCVFNKQGFLFREYV
jgi:hypothetical protein